MGKNVWGLYVCFFGGYKDSSKKLHQVTLFITTNGIYYTTIDHIFCRYVS